MSLDVYLENEAGDTLFAANITHNLGEMARVAGIYACLWRPDENGITVASEIIKPLEEGLEKLVAEKEKYESFNASNGWGTWNNFVPWCADYLQACRNFPTALVKVSR